MIRYIKEINNNYIYMTYTIIWIILIVILLLNLFVFLLWQKIDKLENLIIDLFKKRNNQVNTIYWISWDTLVKKDEIFKNFFELKRKDFWENYWKISLEAKIDIYKKIHNEINFIFKTCEKHPKISVNHFYLYIKDSILEKSDKIWTYFDMYKKIKSKYSFFKWLANLTIIWIFIK